MYIANWTIILFWLENAVEDSVTSIL